MFEKQIESKTGRRWSVVGLSGTCRTVIRGLAFLFLLSLVVNSAVAQKRYNKEHPEVRAMVDLGVQFIKARGGRDDGDLIVQGLAVMNADETGAYYTDPFVIRAVERALRLVGECEGKMGDFDGYNLRNVDPKNHNLHRMYEPCVALMLLVEYDAEKYDPQIRLLIDFIVQRQMTIGAWSYNHDPVGDSSQTQYCCLALWIAHEKGFDVGIERAERVTNFWTSSQASDGSWTYKVVPAQRNASQHTSIVAAGAGSLYMLGDIMGINPPAKAKVTTAEGSLELPGFVERLPIVEIERMQKAEQRNEPVTVSINIDAFNGAKARSNQWMGSNYMSETDHWPYYALYGFERYASFREKIDGQVTDVPEWYDWGIDFCKETQSGDGSFPGNSEAGSATQTALAVLFMVRSTQRLTKAVRDARMVGNRGLSDEIRSRRGKIISVEQKQELGQLLANMSKKDLSPEELQALADSMREGALNNIKGKATAQQLTLLREMVTDERPQVRIVAVRALGQARLVDNCPALIYALTDPNPEVVQEASIALQYVSRKSDVPAVPKAGTKESDGKIIFLTDSPTYKDGIRSLYYYWADWYLELKPNAELFPVDLD